jgi:hypothetical protein
MKNEPTLKNQNCSGYFIAVRSDSRRIRLSKQSESSAFCQIGMNIATKLKTDGM